MDEASKRSDCNKKGKYVIEINQQEKEPIKILEIPPPKKFDEKVKIDISLDEKCDSSSQKEKKKRNIDKMPIQKIYDFDKSVEVKFKGYQEGKAKDEVNLQSEIPTENKNENTTEKKVNSTSVNKEPLQGNGGDDENKDKISFDFKMFKSIKDMYEIKVKNGEFFVYIKSEGAFEHFNENRFKTLIQEGWDDNTRSKLGRNTVIEIIERFKTEPSIQIDDDYFNCYSNLINLWDGVLNIDTGEFYKHSSKFRFLFCVQANFKKNTSGGETFKKFLKTSLENNSQKEMHLQEIVGYMLSDYHCAKKIPMIVGKKHSGKSTLSRIISTLIGKKHVSHVPLHRLHERFILAHMSTKKANICSEISNEAMGNYEVAKALSGDDELVAEYKGKDHFTYQSKIKLMFCGNNDPVLKTRDETSAFHDRLTFIYFNHSVPESERDYQMEEKILEYDRDYIVSWAIEGLKRLRKNNFAFTESDESKKYKKRYIMEQNNTIDFVNSYCVFGIDNRVHLKNLYDAYTGYCYENCFKVYVKDEFFAEISKYEVKKKKFRLGGKSLWGYVGIALKLDKKGQ